MSDRHITQKNTYFLQFMHSIPLDKLEDISVRADSRGKICRDNFCFCCSDVKYRSVRNGLLPPLPSHVVTSASNAVVTYLSRITFPKPSLFSKWILSSCQAQEHYSLLPFEIQMGSKSSPRRVPCLLLGEITPSPKDHEAKTSECPLRVLC